MTNERKVGMHRLNPTHKVDDEVFMAFFPPNLDYYNDLLQDEGFKLFLMSDSTTKEGQDRMADYYQVGKLWEQMDKSECNYQRYFQVNVVKKNCLELVAAASILWWWVSNLSAITQG